MTPGGDARVTMDRADNTYEPGPTLVKRNDPSAAGRLERIGSSPAPTGSCGPGRFNSNVAADVGCPSAPNTTPSTDTTGTRTNDTSTPRRSSPGPIVSFCACSGEVADGWNTGE